MFKRPSWSGEYERTICRLKKFPDHCVLGEDTGTINVADCRAPGGARNDEKNYNDKSLGNNLFSSQTLCCEDRSEKELVYAN